MKTKSEIAKAYWNSAAGIKRKQDIKDFWNSPEGEKRKQEYRDAAHLYSRHDYTVTEETRKKISEYWKDRPKTTEQRKKMSESHKGKFVSDITRQRMRDSRLKYIELQKDKKDLK